MNIREINNTYRPQISSSGNIQGSDKGFKKVLESNIQNADGPGLNPEKPSALTQEVLEHSERMLDLLDNYARDLKDRTKTLREIQPLIDSIQSELMFMETRSHGDFVEEKELQTFIKDLEITANVAVYKFYRGDFT